MNGHQRLRKMPKLQRLSRSVLERGGRLWMAGGWMHFISTKDEYEWVLCKTSGLSCGSSKRPGLVCMCLQFRQRCEET